MIDAMIMTNHQFHCTTSVCPVTLCASVHPIISALRALLGTRLKSHRRDKTDRASDVLLARESRVSQSRSRREKKNFNFKISQTSNFFPRHVVFGTAISIYPSSPRDRTRDLTSGANIENGLGRLVLSLNSSSPLLPLVRLDTDRRGFLGNSREARTPSSSRGSSLRRPRERGVPAAEGTSTPPSRCWPEEG